jgi:hypothetical protein
MMIRLGLFSEKIAGPVTRINIAAANQKITPSATNKSCLDASIREILELLVASGARTVVPIFVSIWLEVKVVCHIIAAALQR